MYSVIGSAKDFMPGKSGKEVLIALRGYDRNEL
jgi:hypothetical protein